jgi:hypothetical protein
MGLRWPTGKHPDMGIEVVFSPGIGAPLFTVCRLVAIVFASWKPINPRSRMAHSLPNALCKEFAYALGAHLLAAVAPRRLRDSATKGQRARIG